MFNKTNHKLKAIFNFEEIDLNNMRKTFLTIIAVYFSLVIYAQKIDYKLSMESPSSHYFQVEMQLKDFKEKELEVKMPIWAPGSYLAREFAKSVDLVTATDQNGNQLPINKTTKNTWRIERGKATTVKVNYEVYAFELSVRTSFLDLSHGYVNGTSIFMYVGGHKDLSGTVRIIPHKDFRKITTALKRSGDDVSGEGTLFTFDNYDQLVDSPIEIGNQIEFEFTAAGTKHKVAMYGTGNYHIPTLQKDMAKIVESCTAVFGENPNKDYTFIIHNTVDGGGGLEHTNSTTLNVNRWTYSGDDYIGFLSLVAHEYFHLWNVKRIRPIELGPFNYDEENYTSLLWVMEGFTSYYDELILRRAGLYSEKEYMNKLIGTINYVENYPGAKVQPVSHASHDAWIKAYRPNENSRNTTISYYSKGQVLAAAIDMMIIDKYNGKKSLDDFMQLLYNTYYKKKNRGFTETEFKKELSDFVKEDLSDFYRKYIDGVDAIPFIDFFKKVDVDLNKQDVMKNNIGVSVNSKGKVRSVERNSDGEKADINVNDEIISIDGYRMKGSDANSYFEILNKGDEVEIIYARDEMMKSTILTTSEKKTVSYKFNKADFNSKKFKYWLRLL